MTAVEPRVFAIIPAAGRSRRMGTAKQLLEIDGRPMLAGVIEAISGSGVAGIVVVTHRAIAEKLPPAVLSSAHFLRNDDEQTEMIDSIRLGIGDWERRASLQPRDGLLVCPGDHPRIAAADFRRCIEVYRLAADEFDRRQPRRAPRIVATQGGRRGHPIIFAAALLDFVRSPACDAGLRELLRAAPDCVREVACDSPGILRDLDAPADLDR